MTIPRLTLAASLLAVLLGSGCTGSRISTFQPSFIPTDGSWARETMQQLTLEEKVAQLVFVWTEGSYLPKDSPGWQELARLTSAKKLGGFIFSIGDVYEYAVQINKLQALADVPLMISADFEYGVGMRIRRSTTFPRAMGVAATGNPQYAYDMGKAIAREARAVGVHQNYAPVVDVNNNPLNPVINTRSYGDDPATVSRMSEAFIRGTQENGVIATVKHFPGHGDTDIDTHLDLPVLKYSRERFDAVELPPFKNAFDHGVMSVMVAHISATAFDSISGIPATVSPSISTRLLKETMGFQGLVVTDAMVMKGVSMKYQEGESAVLAIKAGADLILMPPSADLAIDALAAAVRRGEISAERIDRSVMKVLMMKERLGLHENRFVDVDRVSDVVGSRDHRALAKEIARKSITVLGNKQGSLPLGRMHGRKVLHLVLADGEDPSNGQQFDLGLRRRLETVERMIIDPRSDSLDFAAARLKASEADLVLMDMNFYTRSGEMTGSIPDSMSSLVNQILLQGKPVVGISFGNPYIVMDFPAMDTYVCAYSGSPVVVDATLEVLFAEEPASGTLPITIPGLHSFGDGVKYPKSALRAGDPLEAGFDPRRLAKVDDVMSSAISDTAFPGAELFVARNGIIVLNKPYGFYDDGLYSRPVSNATMYDLASVTKVIATTGAMMRLTEEGRLRLDDRVVQYIPQFGQNGKEEITVYNLMVHNSGLPAWRRFYDVCTTPECVLDSVYASPLVYRTGDSTVYSDLGLITMGKIIERVSGTALDAYVDSVFFKPLGMVSTMYNPPDSLKTTIAPTEVDSFWKKTNRAVLGRVHDENAATLGGVSGHAGLFSTASDLGIYLQMLLNGGIYRGERYLRQETIEKFTSRQSAGSSRAIGWDTKSGPESFSGTWTSMKTFLHTGFTGTSVVCDPVNNVVVVLLTNRVHPTRTNTKIFRARPEIHNAILEAMTDRK